LRRERAKKNKRLYLRIRNNNKEYMSGRISEIHKVKDVLLYETRYEYYGGGTLKKIIFPGGREDNMVYDGSGNVNSVLNSKGVGTYFQYDYDKTKKEYYTQIKTSSGKIQEVIYDREGDTKQVDVNGRTIKKVLKDGRNLIVTDEKGNVTREDYDEWKNLTRKVYPDGSEENYEYEHEFNQVTKHTDQNGNVTLYEYNGFGDVTRKVEAAGTASEIVTTYTYGNNQSAVTIEGDANTLSATTTTTYDANNNVSSITDAEGNVTEFLIYDNMGNLLRKKDPRGKVWLYGYDNKGRLITTTDPLGNITSYEYNGEGKRVALVDPYMKRFEFQYDEPGNVIRTTDPYGNYKVTDYNTDNRPVRIIDQNGKESVFEYDNEKRLLKVIDGAGNEVSFVFDESQQTYVSSGTPVQIEYPTYTKKFYYDRLQRNTRETDILDENTGYSASYGYDPAGNRISKTDQEGNTTTYVYDELSRPVKEIDPLGGVTEKTYDDRGNLISVKDPKNGITRYEYDRINLLKREIRPMGEETVYVYDDVNNTKSVTDAKGQKVIYVYDGLNRVSQIKFYSAGEHLNPIKTVTFTYNKIGKLLTYDDGITAAAYTYDDLHRKTAETVNYGTFSLSYYYTYYANGQKETFTGPDGITYKYNYDSGKRLSGIDIPGQGQITYNAYQWNSPNKTTLPGGSSSDYTYDPLMQLKSIDAKDPGTNQVMNYMYTYSPAGNITTKNTEHGNYGYQYDTLYRLAYADNPAPADEAYTYDAIGNRLTASGVTGAWSYNANNELLSFDDVTYHYDNEGNMISKTDQAGTTTFTYDSENRLIQLLTPDSQLVSYYYDPFGKRLWKDVGGSRTYYFYSEDGLIGEYDSSGNEIKTYGYTPDSTWGTNPLFQKIGGSYYWYMNDHLGTPQKIIDTTGREVWAAAYDSFGKATITTEEITNNLRFPGQYYDAESGLHYNWNRYYDSSIGRYISEDPIGIKGGDINFFSYVGNSPLNWIDPMGLAGGRSGGGVARSIIKNLCDLPDFNMGADWSYTPKCECEVWSCERCGSFVYMAFGPGPFITKPGTHCTCIKYNPVGFGKY
jgi:RHS repeat-associated protein